MSEGQQINDLERLAQQAGDSSVEGDYIPGAEEVEAGQTGPGPDTNQLAEMTVTIVFGMLQNMRGPHWALSEDEETQLTGSLAGTIDYYFDDMEMTPPVALAVSAGMISIPRLAMDMAAKKEAQQAGGADGGQSE